MNELSKIEEINNELLELEEYKNLTDLQRQILVERFENSSLTQEEISEKLDCSRITVSRFLNSKEFEVLSKELGRIKKHNLIPLALKTLEDCMLAKNEGVRLQASLKVLEDSGIIQDSPRTDNSKKIIVMQWKQDKNNGTDNSLPATAVPEGGP